MRLSTYSSKLWLPRPLSEVFPFFADAKNLQAITPPWLSFEVLTPDPVEMREGTKIDYRLRVRGLPIRWQSEITAWQPSHRFIDEQRRGPYRAWIHEHCFEQCDGGTTAIDNVQYAVWGGRLIEWLFVRRDVERIFEFRRQRLLEIFG